MPNVSKFIRLEQFLKATKEDSLILTFEDIERITGEKLYPSAHNYRVYWTPSKTHVLPNLILECGYKIENVDLVNKTISLRHTEGGYTEGFGAAANINNKPRAVTTSQHVIVKTDPSCDLKMDKAASFIKKYHDTTTDGIHTRYLSWVHCNRAFKENWANPDKFEYLSLHLAWYLASWGMLRNSFLLDRDYLVHLEVVKNLCNREFSNLFEYPNDKNIPLVLKAGKTIEKSYEKESISETLVTKILLGVFGCVPAYDRFFKYAARKYKVCSGLFGARSLTSLWDYYEKNINCFQTLKNEISSDLYQYTPMKLLDMCLWQIGFDEDTE